MKKLFLYTLLYGFFSVLQSCCKKCEEVPSPTYCNVVNPLQDLLWLKQQMISDSPVVYQVYEYDYLNNQGFRLVYYPDTIAMGKKMVSFYNCEGTVLCGDTSSYGSECVEYSKLSAYLKLIYEKDTL